MPCIAVRRTEADISGTDGGDEPSEGEPGGRGACVAAQRHARGLRGVPQPGRALRHDEQAQAVGELLPQVPGDGGLLRLLRGGATRQPQSGSGL